MRPLSQNGMFQPAAAPLQRPRPGAAGQTGAATGSAGLRRQPSEISHFVGSFHPESAQDL